MVGAFGFPTRKASDGHSVGTAGAGGTASTSAGASRCLPVRGCAVKGGHGLRARVAFGLLSLARLCRESGFRLLGPNTAGFLNTRLSLTASFLPSVSLIPSGHVGVITQSAGINLTVSFLLANIAVAGCRSGVGFRRLTPFVGRAAVDVLVVRDDTETVGSRITTALREPIPAATPSIQARYSALVVVPVDATSVDFGDPAVRFMKPKSLGPVRSR